MLDKREALLHKKMTVELEKAKAGPHTSPHLSAAT